MELQPHKQKVFSSREILQGNPALFMTLLSWQNLPGVTGIQTFTASSVSFKTESYYIQPNTF